VFEIVTLVYFWFGRFALLFSADPFPGPRAL